jgi:small-conductance mechanosensitive channel
MVSPAEAGAAPPDDGTGSIVTADARIDTIAPPRLTHPSGPPKLPRMKGLLATSLLDLQDSVDRFLRLFGADLVKARSAAFALLLIWLLAYGAWQLVKLIARRIVILADDGDDTRLSFQEKRAQTVAQLLRSVGRVVILLFVLLLSLRQFIDVTPLLAGAGILGLAFSFGAQSLVKDIIAGTFILIENQFAVGDVIEAAGRSGTVERMTLRVVMLRDIDGAVHIIPNGQITTVSNKTRGWSRAVVDVSIGYDADVDAALEIIRDEAAKLGGDPVYGGKFDAPPEVIGVQSLGDNAVAIRVMLRTQPGMQWDVAREFRRRIKVRLDHEGIDIPYPQRMVHVKHSGPGSSDATDLSTDIAAAGGA